MYLLLSPAKKLNEKDHPPIHSQSTPSLLAYSQQIAKKLKTLDAIDISELMKVSTKIGELNALRNQRWQVPFNDSAKPAIYLFDGDAYKGLDAYQLPADAIYYLNEHLGILSGLYGLVRPLDLIMPYRLEMGTPLSIGNHSNLYDFWGDAITCAINTQLASIDSEVLVNVASQEYFHAVKPNQLKAKIITPRFEDKKNGHYKVISFYAKRARGLMVRFCAINHIQNVQELKDFDMEGYYFVKNESSDSHWLFRRG